METILLIKSYLKRLRLPTIHRDFEKMGEEAAAAGLSYERYLLGLVEQEVLQREENMLKLRLKRARFPLLKTLDTYDFSAIPSLNKQEVLQLAQGGYLEKKENIALLGNPGTGKTHLAIALGISACRKGAKAGFYNVANLVTQLEEAQASHVLSRTEKYLDKLDLVILDEVGYVPFSKAGAELLFNLCARRYERGSIIITSNLEFGQWTQVFDSVQMTGALLDRFTHHCHILLLNGESYRFRESQKEKK